MKRPHAILLLAGLAVALAAAQAGIPEPDTVFFGRIINRTSGPEYLVSEGEMHWTIQSLRPGAAPFVLKARIEPFANGAYSYRLKVPHEAVDLSLATAGKVVPLGTTGVAYHHQEIKVNGHPATILPPAEPTVQVGQSRRAAAHRVDLETFDLLPDRNENGLPDWWEAKYRLSIADPQAPIPAGGLSYLEAYRLGLDPRVNPTSPIVLTDRISVPEDGISLVSLHVLDTDTPPERLIYTLVRPPTGGALHVRQGGDPGPALGARTQFSQADVEQGRLVLVHQGDAEGLSFDVELRDDTPEHPITRATVRAGVFRPGGSGDVATALWLDAQHPTGLPDAGNPSREAEPDGALWLDRFGHGWTARSASASALAWSAMTPAGRAALALDGTVLELPTDDAGAVFPPGDRTVMAVFQATGEARQALLSTPHFGLGVSGPGDVGGEGALCVKLGDQSLYSPAPVLGRWTVASVSTRADLPEMSVDGIPAVAQHVSGSASAPATHPSIGAKTLGRFEPVSQSWQFDRLEPFRGGLAEILVFDSVLPSAERQQVEAYLRSKWLGVVVGDGSQERTAYHASAPSAGLTLATYEQDFVPAHGRDRSHLLIGGAGDNTLTGGMEDDHLIAGPGNNRLSGVGERDVFIFNTSGTGTNLITDFAVNEGDVLDLSGLMQGVSTDLADYVRIQYRGTSALVGVNTRGEGGGYADLQITLANVTLQPEDLGRLWTQRRLLTGQQIRYRRDAERGPTVVSLTASAPAVGVDEGPAGAFRVARTGPLEDGLTVALHVGGSAANGQDYSYIPSEVSFAPGSATAVIPFELYPGHPLAGQRVVELTLLAGEGYTIGTPARAQVGLRPAPERISIGAGQALATRSDPLPGTFIVTRSGGLDHATVVPLRIGGSAVNGLDYDRLAASVTFPAGTASVILTVNPKTSRPVLAAPLVVTVELVPDTLAGYVLGEVSAQVALVEQQLDFELWRVLHGLDRQASSTVAAGQDPDADRLPNLAEYAFGLDPNHAEAGAAFESLPRARLKAGQLNVTFKRPLAITDLRYHLQTSADLVHWTAADADFEPVELTEFANETEMVCLAEKSSTRQALRRYVCVQATRQ